MGDTTRKNYTVSGPKGLDSFKAMLTAKNDPLEFVLQNSLRYGDIIPCNFFGKKIVQINHPDLIRHILIENHKNYKKSSAYHRFEPSIGKSLLTSSGEKWKRDRQKLQPMFRRETVEKYYYAIVNEVVEQHKQQWLRLTNKGRAQMDISKEMADITMGIILRLVFGKNNLTTDMVSWLHHAFDIAIDYHKHLRLFPKIHLQKIFYTGAYRRYARELAKVENLIKIMSEQYITGRHTDKDNMLAQLIDTHQADPQNFTARDVRDHSIGMILAGFETTSILMQWAWHSLDYRPDIAEKTCAEIGSAAPSTLMENSLDLPFEQIGNMPYLDMVLKECMRLYPPLWAISQEPIEDDYYGNFRVEKGTEVVLPPIVMHRHPQWWDNPNAFIPERFLPEAEEKMDQGLYFPFSLGPRKCVGQRLAEIESKVVFAKLLPLFKVTIINATGNSFFPRITLKTKYPMLAEISRRK